MFLLVFVLSVLSVRCERENRSLTDQVVSYHGQTQPGIAELQFAPPPFLGGINHALMSKIFDVLTFLIVGGACIGSFILLLLFLVFSVLSVRCKRENLSLAGQVVSYNGQTQPGRMELQASLLPVSQQIAHCNWKFEGLTLAILSKIFAVLTFLIVGGACMGSSMIDRSSYGVLLTSYRPGTDCTDRDRNYTADIHRESIDFSRSTTIF